MIERTSAPSYLRASAVLSAALTLCAGARPAFAAPVGAFPNTAQTSPVQTFNVRPARLPSHAITARVGPDTKPKFKTFELTGPARETTRDIAVGSDHNLWISTDCVGTIERLTPKGVSTSYSYGIASQCDTSTSITPGPDGDLWFVDQFANIVAKISTKGEITEYPLPAASPCNYYPSAPLGIVAGPDGAMWFTLTYPGNPFCSVAGYAPAIGRITTDGTMTFYYTAPPGTAHTVSPERIVAGPDGNLYFVAALPSSSPALAVGVITTSGQISYSSAFGTAANYGDYLAFGPDGNLWVTDEFDQEIFRIAGSQITGFAVGTYGGVQESAYGLTSGPDHALWFTTSDDNEIGRISTNGQVSFYSAPSCAPNNCGGGGGIVLRKKSLWHTLPGNRETQDIVEISRLP